MKTKIAISTLRTVCMQLLKNSGVPVQQAEIITESILYAHRIGRDTHGLSRLPIYLNKISSGFMSPITRDTFIKDSTGIALIDANNGFGQVAAYIAMSHCVEKAERLGIAAVGVRNSNNLGAAGFIVEQAVKRHQIGIVVCNTSPAITPPGGVLPLLGTNPLALAFPNPDGDYPIVLDMACSVVSRGNVRQAAKDNQKIPLHWALDHLGVPTDEPGIALKGSMAPIGNHKGYGLALVIDVLAGLLTGAAFGGEARPLSDMASYSNYGHLCISISTDHFMARELWSSKVLNLISNVFECGDTQKIRIPGQRSSDIARENIKYIYLQESIINEIDSYATSNSINISW